MVLPRNPTTRRRGLTIIEVVISTMIVGLMLVSAMNCVGQVIRGRLQTADVARAKALAQQLMTEVLRDAYKDAVAPVFGPETGEITGNRSAFDDVDDYNDWTASPPKDRAGTSIPNLSGWQRSVTVEFVVPTAPATVSGTDQGVKRITVTVSRGGSALAKEVSLRTDQYEVVP